MNKKEATEILEGKRKMKGSVPGTLKDIGCRARADKLNLSTGPRPLQRLTAQDRKKIDLIRARILGRREGRYQVGDIVQMKPDSYQDRQYKIGNLIGTVYEINPWHSNSYGIRFDKYNPDFHDLGLYGKCCKNGHGLYVDDEHIKGFLGINLKMRLPVS